MDDLIKRLENAEKGSRELDKAIARALGFRIAASTGGPMIMRQNDNVASWDLPHYTTSLDAALTLVPEEFDWLVSHVNGGLTIFAQVGPGKEYFAETAPLALCIAALKAR